MTQEQYDIAKDLYLNQNKSLTYISKQLHINRGKLSIKLKQDGIQIINKQNLEKCNSNIFHKIDTEEKAYWLGFLYADGYVSAKDNGIELSLKSNDIHHLEKFIAFLDFKNKHIFQDNIRCRLNFRNKIMKQDLIQQGCIPQKSLILTFPTYKQVPNNLLPHFIRGYIDGDGSIMIKNNKIPRLSILGTYDFLSDMIKEMNWKQNKIRYKDAINKRGVCTIEWCGKYVIDYLDMIYQDANIYLDRKYKLYQILKENN